MNKAICLLLLLPLLANSSYGQGMEEETAALTQVYTLEEALDEEERELSGDLRIDGSYDAGGALARIWDKLRESVVQQFHGELRFALGMVAAALLGSLASALSPDGKIPGFIELAACCGLSLLLAGSLDSVINQATDTLDRLSDYSRAAMPAFFTAVAACGAVTSASAKYAAFCLAVDVFMSLSRRLIVPLIYAYLAISVSSSLFDNAMLRATGRFTKWCAVTAMTAVTTVFGLYLSLAGLISGSTDAVAVKTTRTVISSVLPVVGGILSDSAGMMLWRQDSSKTLPESSA